MDLINSLVNGPQISHAIFQVGSFDIHGQEQERPVPLSTGRSALDKFFLSAEPTLACSKLRWNSAE